MSSKRHFSLLIATVLILLIVQPAFSGGKQEEEKVYQMRTVTVLAKADPVGIAMQRFCDLVEARSDGRIQTTANFGNELGTQREQCEMVQGGSLEMVTSLTSGTGRYVPQLAVFAFPYVFKDDAHVVRCLDAMEDEVSRLLAPHNFVAIGGQNMGFRHCLIKPKPVYKVADFKGLKMRGPDPVYAGMFEAFGADAITTDWSEIYGALQTGVIDGMEASPAMIYSMKFQEQARYFSKTYHIAAAVYYMFNKKWYDGLPEDLRKIVEEAAREGARYQAELRERLDKEKMQAMIDEGVIVNEVDDMGSFREVQEGYKQKLLQKGPEWQDFYDKLKAID